jgi:hypothetical protein
MKTRAQSQIIATILIIMIVLVSVVIVWNIVNESVSDSASQVNINPLLLKGNVVEFSYNDDAEIEGFSKGDVARVKVERGSGKGEISGIKLVFEDYSGNLHIFTSEEFPEELETETYLISKDDARLDDPVSNFEEIKGVTLSYVYEGNSGDVVTRSLDDFDDVQANPSSSENPISKPLVAIVDCEGLQNIQNDLNENYSLAKDIDCSGVDFLSIGGYSAPFSGSLDGKNKIIKNLKISSDSYYQGLFGVTSVDAKISNLGLVGVDINTRGYSGGLVGYNRGEIINCYSSGSISVDSSGVGGLVGYNPGGKIINSYSTAEINGVGYVGGLVGYNSQGIITNSYSEGDVYARYYGGGIIGYSFRGIITNSYSKGVVILNSVNSDNLVGYEYQISLVCDDSELLATTNCLGP